MLIAVAVVLGLLVLLAVVPAIVGLLLPPEHHTAAAVELNQTPQAVWDAVMDGRRHPVSGPMCRKVEPLQEGPLPSWREDLGRTSVTVRTLEADPPRHLVRALQDAVVPMSARWVYDLTPIDHRTRLRLTEDMVIEAGNWRTPYFRVMIRLFTGGGLKAHLRGLARTFGESPAITVAPR